MIAISGLTNALIQLAAGFINRYMGAAWGYRSALVFSLLLLFLLVFIRKKTISPSAVPP
jgi:hypothetical protein